MSNCFRLQEFDIHKIICELSAIGATSVPLLTEDFRLKLLQEAKNYCYILEPETVGKGNQIVRQQLGSFSSFPTNTQYNHLKVAFQNLLDQHLSDLDIYPFATNLEFNSMVLQKYEPSSIGITPHCDRLSYINLICIFNIGGQGNFCVCADRSGSQARVIDSPPGNVIFLKAPQFMNSSERPFHYVSDIQTTRYTFGLRQSAA